MFDITGFNKSKVVLIAIVLTCLLTLLITLSHLVLSIEVGGVVSICLIFSTASFTLFLLLYFLHRSVSRHAKILRGIVDELSDVIVVKDYAGNFVFCNDAVAKLYNSTPQKMVGKSDYLFTNNKTQSDFFIKNVQSIMNRYEKEQVYESSTDINSGDIRHFQSIKIPYRDGQNRLKIAVIAKDITEITRLKDEADRNKKRLEHVLEVSEEGLWEWDLQSNHVLHNKQWELITGIEYSDYSFKEFESCILPEDSQLVSQALEGLITKNKHYSIEFRMKRPDGKIVWVWDRGQVAEYDEKNNPTLLVGIVLDITEQKSNQHKITNLAYFDQLTGLVNRVQLELELQNTIEKCEQQEWFSAVLFLDLDRFKQLNDNYGHHMGDNLLKEVARRLKNISNQDVTISRFGGDEFVILLPFLDRDKRIASNKAQQYSESIINEIAKTLYLKSDAQNVEIEYSITASVGGVVFQPDDLSVNKLLQLADIALYRAKAAGGHLAMVFDTNIQNQLSHEKDLHKTMYDSIVNRDFCIYLQPKYDIEQKIVGAEALVRWSHPQLGLLAADAFLDMAEESNFIIPIGSIVLEQACQLLQKWQRSSTTEHLQLSVKFSAKQIWQSLFVEEFVNIIESYNIDHTKLIVEITESVLIQDISDATEKLARLKRYGITISLDDFGTGHSSISYLKALPIDQIKIDRTFIQDMTKDKQSHMMVKSIVDLAKNFNLNVVSEGVEELLQFELLKTFKVNQYQGYYFSKPIPEHELEALLTEMD